MEGMDAIIDSFRRDHRAIHGYERHPRSDQSLTSRGPHKAGHAVF
jgi:hypothetical protein